MEYPQQGLLIRPYLWYNEYMDIKPLTVQYLAGLIDGEGYLAMLQSRAKGLTVQSFEPVIKIGMTGETALEIMQRIKSMYGGNIDKRSKPTKGGIAAYTINLKGKNRVGQILQDILPYLIVKREQAELLLEFCNSKSVHTRYAKYNPMVVDRNIELFNQIKSLKRPVATTN